MRRRLALLVPVLLSAATLTPRDAAAQSNVRIGGFLGVDFDNDEDWLILGAEARLRGERMQFDVQPRVHYRPTDFGSLLQLDGNVLFNLTSLLSQIQPYMGLGVAFVRFNSDDDSPGAGTDDTKAGANLISGLILGTNPKWRPYVQFEYTIINDFANRATFAIGILWQLKGTRFNSGAPVRR